MSEPRIVLPAALDPTAFATRDPRARITALSGETMGTTWSVHAIIPADRDPAMIDRDIRVLLGTLVAEMSHWEPASDLCRFNVATGWRSLPSDFFTVLEEALRIAALSDGAFDPALGRLVDLWGFGPAPRRDAPPDPAEIRAVRNLPGWRAIDIDPPARRAFQPGGVALDFSGIAKGHAVDRVTERLMREGVRHALVEIGGELRGIGVRPDGQPWWVAVEPPPGALLPELRIALHGLSIATSGDYQRAFEHDGVRYAHSIDPRSGWPIANRVASVAVVHPRCMTADAWATALTVLGPEDGRALADREGIAARWVMRTDDGLREGFSAAMAAMLE